MAFRKSIWLGAALVAAAYVGAPSAKAQQLFDFSTYSGTSSRGGRSGDPVNNGSGRTNLRWWTPNGTGVTFRKVTIDNTDTIPPTVDPIDGFPWTANPYGHINASGTWSSPLTDVNAILPSLIFQKVRRATPDTTTGAPANFNWRDPSFRYSRCTPSAVNNQTQSATGNLSTFSWTFNGVTTSPLNYGAWINIPAGRTQTFAGDPSSARFSQDYYVVEVDYGPGGSQKFVDIINTRLSGFGWIRIGGGGLPTNRVFPFDGTNPIVVKLYNTVPRDANGKFTMPETSSSGEHGLDNYLVYADAVQFQPVYGIFDASPVAMRLVDGDPNSTRVTSVSNVLTVGEKVDVNGNPYTTTVVQAEVTSRKFDDSTLIWNYHPNHENGYPVFADNTSGNTSTPPFSPDNSVPHHGDDAALADVTNATDAGGNPAPDGTVYYNPTLGDETYEIWIYLPGSDSDHRYAKSVAYLVQSDNGSFTYYVDQSLPQGWYKLGNRRFRNNVNGGKLQVWVTNYSSRAADVSEERLVYADAIRFVGEDDRSVKSTPINATAQVKLKDGTISERKIVIIADEAGYIHCLDAVGNPDGTTTEYWSYPSLKDSNGYDPNLGATNTTGAPDYNGPASTAQEDRQPTAAMPIGFNLTSGIVQRMPDGKDYLFIGSEAGRVYCISIEGRGDYQSTDATSGGDRTVGTTFRVWTYPATYPSAIQFPNSDLGQIYGSISYGAPGNKPTIFVPTVQGRLYALDAVGNLADKSTTVAWAYPARNERNLGPILSTPTYYNGRVLFGSSRDNSSTRGIVQGRFFSINASNGSELWRFPSDAAINSTPYFATDDFLSSPAVATGAELAPGNPASQPDTVYVLNQNQYMYALNLATGDIVWATNELGVGSEAPLTFTWESVYNQAGAQAPFPVVLVPTQDGRFMSLFARLDDVNIYSAADATHTFSLRTAGGFIAAGESTHTHLAAQGVVPTDPTTGVATGWLYGADTNGLLYAFNDSTDGYVVPGEAPGEDFISPNDPRSRVYDKTTVKFITRTMYNRLRLPNTDPNQPTYGNVDNATEPNTTAYEWGQTLYMVVYRFPFDTTDTDGDAIDPPVVNVQFSVDGKTIRGVAVQARQFRNPATAPTYNNTPPTSEQLTDAQGGNVKMDGYAILAFPLQNSGANSLPPGPAKIQVTLSTAAMNGNNIQQAVMPNPASASRVFNIANPLAVYVGTLNANGTLPGANNPRGIGLSTNPGNDENLGNGSFDSAEGKKSLLTSSAGRPSHGGTGKQVFYVVDRSYMSLLRPSGLPGLDNVRIYRRDLAWEGGGQAVVKPFDPSLYPNFEDLPVNYPNNSLDYPDIRREQVAFTKDPNGSAENPILFPVSLLPPTGPEGSELTEDTPPNARVFRPTPVEVDVDVPRYQPPNNLQTLRILNSDAVQRDSADQTPEQGYIGRFDVFVDSSPNGRVDTTVREPYRSVNLAVGVDVDERLRVTTPTVDLGNLPGGTGYVPGSRPGQDFTGAGTASSIFQPWFGNYAGLFKPFGVVNEGNVNMLDVRVAKVASFNGALEALKIPASENDYRAYLDAKLDLWTDIDPNFGVGPTADHKVILPKPRVQDRVPTKLQSNPRRRENPNLGITGKVQSGTQVFDDVLNSTLTGNPGSQSLLYQHRGLGTSTGVYSPVVGVSVPIGLPVGKYTERVRVFENSNGDARAGIPLWDNANNTSAGSGAEAYTEPGFLVSFNVTETRLTNGSSSDTTSPMLDTPTAGGPAGQFKNANVQPTAARDVFGNLVVAFASNRGAWDGTVTGPDSGAYSLYVGALNNNSTFSANGFSSPGYTQPGGSQSIWSPLRDLNAWRPANNSQWFRQNAGPYPKTPVATLFGFPAASLLPGTLRFGNPSLPVGGSKDPFNPGNYFTGMYMAFTGQAQHTNADNSVQSDSRLFLTVATPSNNGSVGLTNNPFVLPDDPTSVKGKPAVVQVGGTGSSSAIILYPVVAAGQSSILYTRFDGSQFSTPVSLPFGSGFSSVTSPSAVGRIYAPGQQYQKGVVELTFQGRLRGRPYPEVFFARLNASNASGGKGNPDRLLVDAMGNFDQANVFDPLPEIGNEQVTAEAEPGLYRSRGVQWLANAPLTLVQVLNGQLTDLLTPQTAVLDQRTGIVSYDTRLGGKVFIDPSVGTIRFSNAVPSRNAKLYLTYTPRFLRISEGGAAGYNEPNGLFDDRLITDPTFWRTTTGAQADFTSGNAFGQRLGNDRMVFTYNRVAAGGTQAARPFVQTMRYGINLPFRLPTLADGTPGLLDNNGNRISAIVNVQFADGLPPDAFQMDPARFSATGGFTSFNGTDTLDKNPGQAAVYFPASSEGRLVTVRHYAVDESGNIIRNGGNAVIYETTARISLIPERTESAMPILTAVNESGLQPFLDPFTYDTERRPPLVWLIWTSTRNGSPDLYFESISPSWTPKLGGR